MKIKKRYIGLTVAILMSSTTIPCFAANGTSQTASSDGSSSCVVSAVVQSSYSVSLPAILTLTLNNTTGRYEGTYTAGAKGNIASNQYVSIIPDSSFTMTGALNGEVATANVSQSVTKWGKSAGIGQMVIGKTGYELCSGEIDVVLPSQADDYSGSFSFTYRLETE